MLQQIKGDILVAMKTGDTIKRDILRIIAGEVELAESAGKKLSDEQIYSLIRKQIESNNTLIECGHSESAKLAEENMVLDGYLPQTLSKSEIKRILFMSDIIDDIREAGSGKGTGLAMKLFKERGCNVLGSDVKDVVCGISST